ncbi:Aldo-keto reductase dtxS3 [Colletotrichum siamense]|nr:Aldo-keto reductase dtxS3 [Colletotrichum siamense]KAF4876873.1 Aldo-keto reductase dtxS3 [Colletotrichum siamense]
MSQAEFRKLGNSGLRVSVPILGGMSIGDGHSMPWTLQEAEALPLLKAAYDRGINTWDTANAYSNGTSERIIGKALREYCIPREKVVILTKCFWAATEEPEILHWTNREHVEKDPKYMNQYGLSRAAIFNQVNASLERLGTSYIDLLQIHRFDTTTPIEETMEALHDLVQWGKVRYIGASSMYATRFAQMQFCAEKNGWTKFVSMQNQHSLLYREEERELMRFCDETGVGLIPWAPLFRGNLARPRSNDKKTKRAEVKADILTEADKQTIDRVEEIAAKRQWTMAQVALAWTLSRVASPIVGFNTVDRIDEAIGVRGKTLTLEEIGYLEELYAPKAYYIPETL